MIYFTLDGEDSRKYGIYLQRPPEIQSAEPDVEFIKIPGRAGTLTKNNGGFKDNDIELECYIRDIANIGAAYGYMSGSKKLIISTNPERSYRATFYGKSAANRVVRNMKAWEFVTPVNLKPFRYFEPEPANEPIMYSGASIYNPGSAPAAPRITIAGSGDITIQIGQFVMEFEGVKDGIIIDSDKNKLLNADGITNALEHDIDEFPILVPGVNYIQYDGDITSMIIEPRWRDR